MFHDVIRQVHVDLSVFTVHGVEWYVGVMKENNVKKCLFTLRGSKRIPWDYWILASSKRSQSFHLRRRLVVCSIFFVEFWMKLQILELLYFDKSNDSTLSFELCHWFKLHALMDCWMFSQLFSFDCLNVIDMLMIITMKNRCAVIPIDSERLIFHSLAQFSVDGQWRTSLCSHSPSWNSIEIIRIKIMFSYVLT